MAATLPAARMGSASLIRLGLCVALTAVIAWGSALLTRPQIGSWYAGLAKPAWTPPNALFPIVWSLLYLMMAVALWRLWDRAPATSYRRCALTSFMVQLALNAVWSPVFFGLHAVVAGLVVLVLLLLALASTIDSALQADPPAAWLLMPYLAWVTFAAALNGAIFTLN